MPRLDHYTLIVRGLDLYEARRYSAALPFFERAMRMVPNCPWAIYNLANTLHMLERDNEAELLLRRLLGMSDTELQLTCISGSRSVRLDAHYLLFKVLIYGRGFSPEAFAFADEHLRLRRRGLHSVFSIREVRRDVAGFRQQWLQGQSIATAVTTE